MRACLHFGSEASLFPSLYEGSLLSRPNPQKAEAVIGVGTGGGGGGGGGHRGHVPPPPPSFHELLLILYIVLNCVPPLPIKKSFLRHWLLI